MAAPGSSQPLICTKERREAGGGSGYDLFSKFLTIFFFFFFFSRGCEITEADGKVKCWER